MSSGCFTNLLSPATSLVYYNEPAYGQRQHLAPHFFKWKCLNLSWFNTTSSQIQITIKHKYSPYVCMFVCVCIYIYKYVYMLLAIKSMVRNYVSMALIALTQFHVLLHISVAELDHQWFRWWHFTSSVWRHNINQWLFLFNHIPRNRFQWNDYQNYSRFIGEKCCRL